MNADLERLVNEHARDWMKANSELAREIDDRERVEADLRESRQFLQTIIDSEPECVKLLSSDGTLIMMNRAGLAMIQAGSFDEVKNKPLFPLILPPYRDDFKRMTGKVFLGKQATLTFEMAGLRGRRLWLDTHAVPLRGKNNEIIALLAITRDVTEQKRAEEALLKESRFISTVLDTVGAMVLVLDREGRIVRFNRSCEEVSGYSFDEAQGRRVWDFLLPPEQVAPVQEVFRNLTAGQLPSRYENYWVAKDGGRKLIDWSNTVLLDRSGAVEYVIATGIDITGRRITEESLQDREERYRLLFHRTPIGIFNYDTRLIITDCNDSFVSILRSTRDRLIGLNMNGLEDQSVLPAHRASLEGREGIYEGPYRATTSNAAIWISLRTTPLYGPKGVIIGGIGIVEDITARKEAEQSVQTALLRAEEEKNKFEAIVSAIGDGISIQDLDFKVVYQNQRHRNIIGNHIGEYCYEAYQNKEKTCDGCPVALSFRDGNVHTVERSSTVPGRKIYVEVSASPLRDASGKIIAGIEAVRDITARKQTEQAVIERSRHAMLGSDIGAALTRENELQPTLQSCAEAIVRHLDAHSARIWTLDPDSIMLELRTSAGAGAQPGAGRLPVEDGDFEIGRIAKERKPYLTNHAPGDPLIRDRDWALREGVSAFAGYPLVVEDRLVGVLGVFSKEAFSEATVQALSSVADEIALGIERKRMERERENLIHDLQALIATVSRSHKEWQNTFDGIQDPIFITDAEYKITKANRAFVEFLGKSFPEILGLKCHELIHQTPVPFANCPHQAIRSTGNPADVEFVEPKSKRTLIVSHFPYLGPDGQFGGCISIVRDMTQDREKEMRYIMNERLASLGQMAASIAHEINNPLAAILGCAEGLLNRVNSSRYDPTLFRNYLKIVEEEIARCKRITTGMLSFVRKSSPERKAVDLRSLIDRALEIVGFQGRLKEVQVEKRFAPADHAVFGSDGELIQVFLAVITNALDAMNEKGSLTIDTIAENGRITVTIGDTGQGISQDNINRIFDPFFTTRADQGGTGLGLAIARKIVLGHSGDIHASAEEGTGATLTISLPVS